MVCLGSPRASLVWPKHPLENNLINMTIFKDQLKHPISRGCSLLLRAPNHANLVSLEIIWCKLFRDTKISQNQPREDHKKLIQRWLARMAKMPKLVRKACPRVSFAHKKFSIHTMVIKKARTLSKRMSSFMNSVSWLSKNIFGLAIIAIEKWLDKWMFWGSHFE